MDEVIKALSLGVSADINVILTPEQSRQLLLHLADLYKERGDYHLLLALITRSNRQIGWMGIV